jgi:hypothetical protein
MVRLRPSVSVATRQRQSSGFSAAGAGPVHLGQTSLLYRMPGQDTAHESMGGPPAPAPRPAFAGCHSADQARLVAPLCKRRHQASPLA